MKLHRLVARVPGANVHGPMDVEITDVAYDSRNVMPGSLFVAIIGHRDDGHRYVKEALARGAVAVIGERPLDLPEGIPFVHVTDARYALAQVASVFYGDPSKEIRVIGVTGTNGKTTTTYLVRSILRRYGRRVGLIGTVQNLVGDEVWPHHHTTPESVELQKMLRAMVDHGLEDVIMEVSSHAIALHRVAGTEFDIAALTNVTQDHLDFHASFEEYRATKAKLFQALGRPYIEPAKPGKKFAVLNQDQPQLDEFLRSCIVPVYSYSTVAQGEIRATDIVVRQEGVAFNLVSPWGERHIKMRLTGRFNVQNALAAASICLPLGVPLEVVTEALAEATGAPGRLEAVQTRGGYSVMVDYAHTPDGLENVLATAREFTSGKVIVVFGCGGDRDRGKRPQMGAIAGRLADQVILTTDNPRSEDPKDIIAEIEEGLKSTAESSKYEKILDRGEAIHQAVQSAQAGDVVLIVGKGHETYQIFRDQTTDWDDRQIARQAIAKKETQ